MERQKTGTVKFDTINVMGRDFLPVEWKDTTGFFEYVFSVDACFDTGSVDRITVLGRAPKKQKKEKEGTKVNYHWSGHFNLHQNSTRIHLHNEVGDPGLYKLETKLRFLREHLSTFLSEHRARTKKPAKEALIVKEWLNPPNTHFTGHVTYMLSAIGNGHFAIADCHRAIHWWVDLYHDENGKVDKFSVDYANKTLKAIETVGKGLDKALKGIEDLRKFFDRELDEPK